MAMRVDVGRRRSYTPQLRDTIRGSLFVVALVGFGACATTREPTAGPVSPALEREARQTAAPGPPLRALFDWRATERDARFSGRGAARIQGPHFARIDLFGPRGEGVLSAALVGDDLRIPPDVAPTEVPPVPLLWSVFGVFRPPAGARLVATRREDERTTLEYADAGAHWRFEFVAGRLRHAEWRAPDGNRHTVALEGTAEFGFPAKVVYRDWAAFTELTLTLDEIERVEPFPEETWTPGAP
ncbi:MAG TPA: hypothetical protein VF188_04475 [Longimicrobiales bacterium]